MIELTSYVHHLVRLAYLQKLKNRNYKKKFKSPLKQIKKNQWHKQTLHHIWDHIESLQASISKYGTCTATRAQQNFSKQKIYSSYSKKKGTWTEINAKKKDKDKKIKERKQWIHSLVKGQLIIHEVQEKSQK